MHSHHHLSANFSDAMNKLKLPYFKRKAVERRQSKEAKEAGEVAAFKKSLRESQSLIYRNSPSITYEGMTIINPKYRGPNPCVPGPRVVYDEYLFNEAVHNKTWDPSPLGERPSTYDDWD